MYTAEMAFFEIGTIAVASIIAQSVFDYALNQSGIGEKFKAKLRRNPTKDAFARALQKALAEFETKHQTWVRDGFDQSFLEREATPVLAACLLRSHGPDAVELAWAWAKSLSKDINHERIKAIRPVLKEFLDALEREMRNQPDLADLMRDRHTFADPNRLSFSTRYDYLSWLLDQHTYLDLRGTLQTYRDVRLKLAEVFVSLTGEAEKTREQDRDLERLLRDKADLGPREEAMDEARARLRERRTEPAKTVELAHASKQYAKLVLLGDPGSGKSTLLRYLAHMHATAQRDGAVSAGTGGELGPTLLPIFVRIADFVERPNWRSESLSDALPHLLSSQECNAAGLATLLDTELAQGKCLVLLDGLDEVLTAADRNAVVHKIENLLHGYGAGNRYVVTSRIAGYLAAPLAGEFATFTVQDMSEAQITQFLNGYCIAIENAQTPDLSAEQRRRNAQAEIDALLKAFKDNSGVARLAKNPLMLRTIALIHRSGQTLPRKRSELYKLTADTLARTWDEAKGIRNLDKIELLREEMLTPILSAFAYWLHREKPSGVASETETRREIGAAYAKRKGLVWDAEQPSAEIERAVSDFLQVVRERTGLLIERAPRRYGFMHLTFEEYYAARHMVARASQRAKLIRQHLHDPRWQEPILLALGHVAADSPDDAAELVEQAILARDGEFAPSAYEDVLGRDFLFALRCAGDGILPSPAVQQQLAARATDEVLYRRGLGVYGAYRQRAFDLFALMKDTSLQGMLVQKSLPALRDESRNVRSRAAAGLGQLAVGSEAVLSGLLGLLRDEDSDVRPRAAASLVQLGVGSEAVLSGLLGLLRD
ncbi:MAG: HEAT repeat domain-containing protein, partial [Anaerolineae bacterium]|nr:HEAT repeat domain-containing protein [Anaerolineae bacterium]